MLDFDGKCLSYGNDFVPTGESITTKKKKGNYMIINSAINNIPQLVTMNHTQKKGQVEHSNFNRPFFSGLQ